MGAYVVIKAVEQQRVVLVAVVIALVLAAILLINALRQLRRGERPEE